MLAACGIIWIMPSGLCSTGSPNKKTWHGTPLRIVSSCWTFLLMMMSLVTRNLLPLQALTLFFPSGSTLSANSVPFDTPLGRCWPYQPQLEMEPAGPHISVATPIGTLCSSGTGNSKARQRSNSLPAAELTLVLGDLSRHLVSMKPYEIANHMTQLSIRTSQMSSVTLCPGEKSLTTQPNWYVMFASVCVLVPCLTFCKTSTSESAKTPFPCSSACQRLFVKGWQIQQYILVLPAFACILLHRTANKQYIGLSHRLFQLSLWVFSNSAEKHSELKVISAGQV